MSDVATIWKVFIPKWWLFKVITAIYRINEYDRCYKYQWQCDLYVDIIYGSDGVIPGFNNDHMIEHDDITDQYVYMNNIKYDIMCIMTCKKRYCCEKLVKMLAIYDKIATIMVIDTVYASDFQYRMSVLFNGSSK